MRKLFLVGAIGLFLVLGILLFLHKPWSGRVVSSASVASSTASNAVLKVVIDDNGPPTLATFSPQRVVPPSQPSPLDLPERIKPIWGTHGESYVLRLETLNKLRSQFSGDEVKVLPSFLYLSPEGASLSQRELNALKNEVVNVLKERLGDSTLLIRHLTSLAVDPQQDDTWRDYCIQHLGTLHSSSMGQDRASVEQVLWNVTDVKQKAIAGTALIALANNEGKGGIRREAIADKALAISGDSTYDYASRLTAVQICAKLSDARILPVARSLVHDSVSIPLQTSAIAVLGFLGDASDEATLNGLLASPDIRLRGAAQSALERLEASQKSKSLAVR